MVSETGARDDARFGNYCGENKKGAKQPHEPCKDGVGGQDVVRDSTVRPRPLSRAPQAAAKDPLFNVQAAAELCGPVISDGRAALNPCCSPSDSIPPRLVCPRFKEPVLRWPRDLRLL